MVIIVDHDEISELQMTGRAGSFTSNALHGTSISKKGESMVIDQIETRLVELSSGVGLRNGQANGVSETLTKRSSSDFNSRCILSFWVPGGDAVNLLRNENRP